MVQGQVRGLVEPEALVERVVQGELVEELVLVEAELAGAVVWGPPWRVSLTRWEVSWATAGRW